MTTIMATLTEIVIFSLQGIWCYFGEIIRPLIKKIEK